MKLKREVNTKLKAGRGLEPEDFYINEQGYTVFTRTYHLKRGYCCRSGCLHCPYGCKKGN